MGLELPGVSVIETPAEARASARRWRRMAAELDSGTGRDQPQVQEKTRELRQRAKASEDWARRQEDALLKGQQAHDREQATVTPLHGGSAQQQHGDPAKPERGGRAGYTSAVAREAGHRAYQAARPQAMRVGQHVFQGVQEPFGPVGASWDLFWEAIGVTLGVILISDLLRAPRAIVDVSQHSLGALDRLVGLGDPLTGLASGGRAAGSTHAAPTSANAGGFLPSGVRYKPGRHDQGQDGQTTPGGPIIAPGNGYVVAVKSNPGGFGPSYPVVHFTSGPYVGHDVYIGHTISALKAGARFLAGSVISHTGTTPIGNATVPGWFEIGYAPGGVPGPTGQPVPF